jgi:hypothetical protein
MRNSTIAQVQRKQGDSHIWSGLMKVKDFFLNLGQFHLGNGQNVRFWKDKWLGNFTLGFISHTLCNNPEETYFCSIYF